jgi:hypothetical protein
VAEVCPVGFCKDAAHRACGATGPRQPGYRPASGLARARIPSSSYDGGIQACRPDTDPAGTVSVQQLVSDATSDD